MPGASAVSSPCIWDSVLLRDHDAYTALRALIVGMSVELASGFGAALHETFTSACCSFASSPLHVWHSFEHLELILISQTRYQKPTCSHLLLLAGV
jgi:hypothetical protein